MKKKLLLFALMCFPAVLMAQQDDPKDEIEADGPWLSRLEIETRFGWNMNRYGGINQEGTGFRGEFVNLRLEGKIYNGLTYSWKQRLNKNTSQTFWDATDWLEIKYTPNDYVAISAGKQVVAIGGWEYDRSPIDLYLSSEYWQYINCYQLGFSIAVNASRNDRLVFQLCNSPMRTYIGDNSTVGLSLMWYGKHDWYHSIFSANAFQTTGGRWINYLCFGNKFLFSKNAFLELDYVNRASSNQSFWFKDCTVVAEASVKPHSMVRLFGKYTFDTNDTDTDADVYVENGTRLHTASMGVEYSPIRKYPDALRLHAAGGYVWGRMAPQENSAHPFSGLHNDCVKLYIGAKVNLDVLHGIKHIIKKAADKRIAKALGRDSLDIN